MVKLDNTFTNNTIKIGENQEDNSDIIKKSKQNDIWFHLAEFPSCHVIMSADSKHAITKKMIVYCANLVKENSRYKNLKNLRVNYCQIKNIKKTDTKGKVKIKSQANTIII